MIRAANYYSSVKQGDTFPRCKEVCLSRLNLSIRQSQNQLGAEEMDDGEMTRENSKPAASKAKAAVLGPAWLLKG
jgi:hypothetical protein